jgi:protein O-mannosyl-transferase
MDARIIIFLTAFFLYSNTFFHDFVLDDAIVFSENQYVKQGVQGLKDIFTKDSFAGFFGVEGKDKLVAGGRYRPLSLATFALEVSIFGVQSISGHIINALLYGWLGIIIFYVFRFFIKNENTAFWMALLFVVHPIHTEVVANIKGRDELLAMLCSISALWMVLKRQSLILASILMFLALLSKENSITFLAIIPLTTWFVHHDGFKKRIITVIPFLIASLIFLWLRSLVSGGFSGGPSLELLNNPFITIDQGYYRMMDLGERSGLILLTLGKYLQVFIFPYPLTHDYYPMFFSHEGLLSVKSVGLFILHMLLFGAGIYGVYKKKLFGYAILFYGITLSIVSNLFFPVGTNMSERFLFMPSFGLILLYSYVRKPVWMVIVVLFGAITIYRNFDWKDNLTLFSKDILVSSQSAKLNNALGGVLIEKAIQQFPYSEQELKKSQVYLEKAIQIHPRYKNAFLLKGNASFYLSDYEGAIQAYLAALTLDADYEEARANLGLAYRDAGRYYGEKLGNMIKAKEFLSLAYEIIPKDYEVLRLLGVAEGLSGNNLVALEWFKRAILLQPDDAYANLNLATAFFNLGMREEGNIYLERAKSINPAIISSSR